MWQRLPFRAGRVSAFLVTFLALVALSARTEAATPEPAKNSRCSHGSKPALSELACELAAATQGIGDNAVVIAAPLRGIAVRSPEAVTARLASLVAGAIGGSIRPLNEAMELPRARAQARGSKVLIFLNAELSVERLTVTLDAYPVSFRFWDRVRNPTPGAIRHAFSARALDPELRSLLPSVPLVVTRIDKATTSEREVVALACGDADGDGSNEIAVVGRHRVSLGRIRKAMFQAHAQVSWLELSTIAQSPLREPIASAWIPDTGVLEVGSTDRRDGFRFQNGLSNRVAIEKQLPWPGGGCTQRDGVALLGRVMPCKPNSGRPIDLGSNVDAVAGTRLIARDGKSRTIWLSRLTPQNSVVAMDDRNQKLELGEAGAQLAAGDLDGDGDPEFITTQNTFDTSVDALKVSTWQSDGKVVERFSLNVPSGVRAIGICPLEGSSMAPLVVATGDGLWVIR